MVASAVEIVLEEEDVPGASLGDRLPEELTVPELKRWLACRGASRTGHKQQLIERVKDYIQSGMNKHIVDPDKGENMEVKRRRLGIVPGSGVLPPRAQKGEWISGLTGVPHLNYSQVYAYLVTSKAITPDGAEIGALKAMKTVKYFKEGYVKNLKMLSQPHHWYISSETKASMKQVHYHVEICLNSATADVLAAQCSCPAGEWPSAACSHVAATLFAVEDYVVHLKDPGSCTSRLQQWHKPTLHQHKPTPVCDANFRKQSCKLVQEPHKERVLRPTIETFDPRPRQERSIDFDRFEKFKNELESCGFKCGLLLQLTPASSDVQHDVQQDIHTQFPLTKEELKVACSKVMETFQISHEAALELERQTRGQSASEKWYASRAGRITASNFGRVCKSTWFKSRDDTKVQSLLKALISPARFSNPPLPIQWGIECEPKAVACYIGLKSGAGTVVEECGLFVHPTHRFLAATADRLVVDPTAFAPDGLLEVKCPWSCRDKTVVDACQDSSFCCELQCGSPRLKVTNTYYYQVQGQMAVTGRSWCDFMVYTNVQVHLERIFLIRTSGQLQKSSCYNFIMIVFCRS